MCGEHQLLQHLATTHGNKRACFSSAKKLSASTPPSHRPLLCSPRRLRFGLLTWGLLLNSGRRRSRAVWLGAPSGLQWGEKRECSTSGSSNSRGLRGASWEASQTPSLKHPQLQHVPRLGVRLWVNKSLLLDRKVFPQESAWILASVGTDVTGSTFRAQGS